MNFYHRSNWQGVTKTTITLNFEFRRFIIIDIDSAKITKTNFTCGKNRIPKCFTCYLFHCLVQTRTDHLSLLAPAHVQFVVPLQLLILQNFNWSSNFFSLTHRTYMCAYIWAYHTEAIDGSVSHCFFGTVVFKLVVFYAGCRYY